LLPKWIAGVHLIVKCFIELYSPREGLIILPIAFLKLMSLLAGQLDPLDDPVDQVLFYSFVDERIYLPEDPQGIYISFSYCYG